MNEQEFPPAASDQIQTSVAAGVGWIIINRPEAANAANPSVMRALCAAIDRFVEDQAVVAIVIRGEGSHFLAGADFYWLGDIASGRESDAGGEIYRWFQGAVRRLLACPKPTVAAVAGAAITVGCELALASDVRIVQRGAFFQENWLDLGLIAPLGGATLLPRLVGLAKAKEMLLECRRVEADEALAIGLANEVVDDQEALFTRAQERAVAMAERPTAAFGLAKNLIHAGLESSLEGAWEQGIAAQSELLKGTDFRTAITARTATP